MLTYIEAGKAGTVITKDLLRLGRDYLKTGKYIEIIFLDYDVRYHYGDFPFRMKLNP